MAGGALALTARRSPARSLRDQAPSNITIISAGEGEIPGWGRGIASGPLTSDALLEAIHRQGGRGFLHFFDAAAPIVTAENLYDMDYAFSRPALRKGTADYINCP